jgi:hypothetical protein
MADHDSRPPSPTPKFPEWQNEFDAVLLEDDPRKLPELVLAAEAAIFLWWQNVVHSPTDMRKAAQLGLQIIEVAAAA